MTTETVEVERTVTEEEELTICDGCGTSDEEHSEMVTFASDDPRTRGNIHLHRQCIGQMNGVDTRAPQGPSIREKASDSIPFALCWPSVVFLVVGVAIAFVAVYSAAVGAPGRATVAAVIGAFLTVCGLWDARMHAREAVAT